MSPEERASEISLMLRRDEVIRRYSVAPPNATEIPIDATRREYLLMVNLYIAPSSLSLSVLWRLTVPVIQRLTRSGKLNSFRSIAIQISVNGQGGELTRVMRVSVGTDFVDALSVIGGRGLLDPSLWDGKTMSATGT